MTDPAHRFRQPAGISTGGQFTTEPKTETPVTLSAAPSTPDTLAETEVARLHGEVRAWATRTRRAYDLIERLLPAAEAGAEAAAQAIEHQEDSALAEDVAAAQHYQRAVEDTWALLRAGIPGTLSD